MIYISVLEKMLFFFLSKKYDPGDFCFFPASPTEMTVTWVTLSQVNASVVEYGIDNLIMVAKGNETAFEDGGTEKRVLYIHRVTLTNLIPGQRYSKLEFEKRKKLAKI